MRIQTTFDGVTQRRGVKTFCRKCRKKLKRAISTTYYRNGFHDEAATRQTNDVWLDKEKAAMEKNGVVCKSCAEKTH